MTNFKLQKFKRTWATPSRKWMFFYMVDNPNIDDGVRQLLFTEWRYAR